MDELGTWNDGLETPLTCDFECLTIDAQLIRRTLPCCGLRCFSCDCLRICEQVQKREAELAQMHKLQEAQEQEMIHMKSMCADIESSLQEATKREVQLYGLRFILNTVVKDGFCVGLSSLTPAWIAHDGRWALGPRNKEHLRNLL